MGAAWRPIGLACPGCNRFMIAPKEVGYVSEHEVFHFWYCEKCEHQMQMVVDVRINAESSIPLLQPSSS